VILYSYAGSENPLIKIIKGIPGDKFKLEKIENTLTWRILINNKPSKNSKDKEYIISERGYNMLSLYERDYKGIIPQNAYLILGNQPGGSLDSTTFGLIDKTDILGKVEY
jgi:signal peptidase I